MWMKWPKRFTRRWSCRRTSAASACKRCARPWRRTISIAGPGSFSRPCRSSSFRSMPARNGSWWPSQVNLGGIVMSRELFDAIHEVEGRIAQAPHLLLGLDFDGTLAPIVEEPQLASLSPHMQRALLALAGHKSVSLAVVSGRERADLQ